MVHFDGPKLTFRTLVVFPGGLSWWRLHNRVTIRSCAFLPPPPRPVLQASPPSSLTAPPGGGQSPRVGVRGALVFEQRHEARISAHLGDIPGDILGGLSVLISRRTVGAVGQ